MTCSRWLLLFIFLIPLVSAPAQADDVIYPTGSRAGITPPPGLTLSHSFTGFEDREKRVALVLVALPSAAYSDLEKSTAPESLEKQGLTVDSREDVAHPLGKAFLIRGHQEVEDQRINKWIFVVPTDELTVLVTVQVPEAAQSAYPDDAIRAALASVSLRAAVPPDEQLSLLPFRVGELAGFKIGGVIAGRAVMLTDGVPNKPAPTIEPHILVAIAAGGPAQASDRDRFAYEVFTSTPSLKDVRINSSEPLRIGGQQGHQIMAHARAEGSDQELTIVQWLRFGGGGYLHLLGVAPTEGWTQAYARFRQVRDGIDLR